MAEPQSGPECNIRFNGLDGKYGKSASLWLAYMNRHRDETGSTPSLYLQRIDDLLEGEAAQWVLHTPSVSALVCKGYVGLATEADVDAFHGALSDHFKLAIEEARAVSYATIADRLRELKQGNDEGLERYYGRARRLLIALRGRDGENEALTPAEVSLRVVVVSGFVAGLSSTKLRHRLQQQQICHHTISLRQAFLMAVAEMKIMKSKKKAEIRQRNDKQNEERERREHNKLVAKKKQHLGSAKKKQVEKEEQSKHHKPSSIPATKPHPNTVKNQKEEDTKTNKRKLPTNNEKSTGIAKKQKRVAKRKVDACYW